MSWDVWFECLCTMQTEKSSGRYYVGMKPEGKSRLQIRQSLMAQAAVDEMSLQGWCVDSQWKKA